MGAVQAGRECRRSCLTVKPKIVDLRLIQKKSPYFQEQRSGRTEVRLDWRLIVEAMASSTGHRDFEFKDKENLKRLIY